MGDSFMDGEQVKGLRRFAPLPPRFRFLTPARSHISYLFQAFFWQPWEGRGGWNRFLPALGPEVELCRTGRAVKAFLD